MMALAHSLTPSPRGFKAFLGGSEGGPDELDGSKWMGEEEGRGLVVRLPAGPEQTPGNLCCCNVCPTLLINI